MKKMLMSLMIFGMLMSFIGCKIDGENFEELEPVKVSISEDGVASFIDNQTKEEVLIYVKDSSGEKVSNINVTFWDGDGFEIFILDDLYGNYLSAFDIYPHNSSHDMIIYAIGDVLSDKIESILTTSEKGKAVEKFAFENEKKIYMGRYTPEQVDKLTSAKLNIIKYLGGAEIIKFASNITKFSDKVKEIFGDNEPEFFDTYIITPGGITSSIRWLEPVEESSIDDPVEESSIDDPVTRGVLLEMIGNGEDVTNVNTSEIIDMSYLFYNVGVFNQDISNWDVSSVASMESMFYNANDFNQDISNWDVSSVAIMKRMFSEADVFNQDISNWDVSSVSTMKYMFAGAWDFNQDISNWDVSSVINMGGMFTRAYVFNQDISNWDVSDVTYMRGMFYYTYDFNQDISNWDVSSVTDMGFMFYNAYVFNQDISSWSNHVSESITHDKFSYANSPLITEYHPYASWNE